MPLTPGPAPEHGVARNYYCEHSASKSRVLALVEFRGTKTLRAVLTTTDRLLAEQAADLLSHVASGGAGPNIEQEVQRVAAALADAPAASFREAMSRADSQSWLIDDPGLVPARDEVVSYYEVTRTAQEVADREHVTPWTRDRDLRTPSDARLADLRGTVVRILSLHEFHVHDSARLLDAARADGWEPEDGLEDLDEADHILDAAMWLTHIEDPVGTDWVSETSYGECLDPAHGDEVADWTEEPITADFGTGWRLPAD